MKKLKTEQIVKEASKILISQLFKHCSVLNAVNIIVLNNLMQYSDNMGKLLPTEYLQEKVNKHILLKLALYELID